MFLFSISSFLDLLNSLICFLLAGRLRVSFQQSGNILVRNFSFFYLVFAIFFLFLGLPFFIPQNPVLIQTSFIIAHLFLYFAISLFSYIFLKLAGIPNYSFFVSVSIAITGLLVFVWSFVDAGQARLWLLSPDLPAFISWSHGGSAWVRLLIGLGGTFFGAASGLFFFFYSKRSVEAPSLKAKGRLLGSGLFLLGAAALVAFVFSIFDFYNFWIVLLAELVTITGLLLVYGAVSLQKPESAGTI